MHRVSPLSRFSGWLVISWPCRLKSKEGKSSPWLSYIIIPILTHPIILYFFGTISVLQVSVFQEFPQIPPFPPIIHTNLD